MKRGRVILETVHGNRMRRFVYASDYEFLQCRYKEALELIEKLRGGVERYSCDLCQQADEFLALSDDEEV